jgi:pyrroloquinoline quinone (PQQ) biosynthesis protein C
MQQRIEEVLEECGFRQNPYFTALRDGSFDKEDFIESQIQFFFAVVFFSRPMAILAAKIPTPDLRMEVVRNVWEEHGEGNLSSVHRNTFLELLSRIGDVSEDDVNKRYLWPSVRIFNTTLVGTCTLDEYLVGVGVMGIIERMFMEISTWLGQGIISRGWLTEERLVHYDVHEVLDLKHSEDFFNVVQPSWDRLEENQYYIDQGLTMGAALFNLLYEQLYINRHKRLFRDVTGFHSRSFT